MSGAARGPVVQQLFTGPRRRAIMTAPRPERVPKAPRIAPRVRNNSQNGSHDAGADATPILATTDIIETAAAAGRFQTFGRAIKSAGLAAMLGSKGPFTVFAPTDKAFARMPDADLNALLENTTELTRVLSYHIVPNRVRAPRAGTPRSSTTATGSDLEISRADGGGFKVNEARILKTNIRASNGVIHAIDRVLVPR
jgi:uncharacterized surface protein with fasciclin (FAS1) repeats